MAIITTAGSGNWNSTTPNAPWPSGTIPSATDCVRIANGHTLTVPLGYTAQCGDSSAPTTAAIATSTTSGTGILIVNGALQVAADIDQGNANWQIVGAGAKIESNNASTALVWYSRGGTNCRITVTGTGVGSNRAEIRNGAGMAGFRHNAAGNRVEHVWRYAKWYDMGSASVNGIEAAGQFAGSGWDLEDSVVDDCGQVAHGSGLNFNAAVPSIWKRVRIKNSKHATLSASILATAPSGGVTRLFEDVAFDKSITMFGGGFTFRRVVFQVAHGITAGQGRWAGAEDCMFFGSSSVQNIHGDVTRGFRATAASGSSNWHGVGCVTAGAYVIDGLIFDGVVANDIGDMITNGNPATAMTVTVRNLLTTKASIASGAYGKLISLGGGANCSYLGVDNCTHYSAAGEAGTIGVGETYAGRADMVAGAHGNLTIGLTSGVAKLIYRQAAGVTGAIKDAVTIANIGNNAIVNPKAGGAGVGNGYETTAGGDGMMWTVVPELPQALGAPVFVDDTRNLATWYRHVKGGTPGTRAADTILAVELMAEQCGDDVQTLGGSVTDAWAWIRAGYAPRNPRLRTGVSTNNNGWLGAVEGNNLARLLAHDMI